MDLVERFLYCSRRDQTGWVYLIESIGRIKVGSASSYQGVRRQLTSAQTYAASGIDNITLVHGGQQFETILHRRFSRERLCFDGPHVTSRGTFTSEWFEGPFVNLFLKEARCSEECEFCRYRQEPLPF